MNRYAAYKDSGVEWLGEVPECWQVITLKGIYRYFGSGTTPESSKSEYYQDGTINWLNTTDLKNCIISQTKNKITELALKEKSLKIYPVNTLAIAMYGQGDTRGSVGLLNIESTTNQAACMMYGSFNSISQYMFWWFVARKNNIRKLNIGATQPNMNQDFIKNLFIAIPTLPEQKIIAEYLDTKTAQIDRKIDLLSQKASRYGELKQSLINETVTRGLDKTVPMKDSGIEWIGETPEHWEVKRLKDISNSINGGAFKEGLTDIGIPIIKIKQLTKQCEPTDFCEPDFYKVNKDNKLQNGDLVFSWSTLIAPFIYLGKDAVLNQHIFKIQHSKNVSKKWLFYKLSQSVSRLMIFTHGSTMQHILKSDFDNLEIQTPLLHEQQAIANYLDKKTTQIDQIIQTINNQIEKLKELRKTLINDVVTGKIKVA